MDHSNVDQMLTYAAANGISVVRDQTQVLTGDAAATVNHIKTATDSYAAQTVAMKTAIDKYVAESKAYDQELAKNQADADSANAQMQALMANLSKNNSTVDRVDKQYTTAADLTSEINRINAEITKGNNIQDVNAEIALFAQQQSGMVHFQDEAAKGNIKLTKQVVHLNANSKGATASYLTKLKADYAAMEAYVKGLNPANGAIPDAQKPTYTLYEFVMDDTPPKVTVPHYTPKSVTATQPKKPVLHYHYYDIRSTPDTDREGKNKDGEVIVEGPNNNTNNKVVQAMVNQVVGVETSNEPLPSNRWDKIHTLEIKTHLPDGVTFNEAFTNVDKERWSMTYDPSTRTVTFRATAKYLVEINKNQNTSTTGNGGAVNGQWHYQAPTVFFKLDKDDHTYQVYSETVVNDEYYVKGKPITIRTDSAKPSKENTDDKFQNIDGKAVLPGTKNNYFINWDFSKYKGVNIDKDMQDAGLVLVDDYPEEALDPDLKEIKVIDKNGKVIISQKDGKWVNENGQEIPGFSVVIVDEKTCPDGLKGKIKGQAVMIQMKGYDNWFYKKYVEGGESVKVLMPMMTKKIDNHPEREGGDYNGNRYVNVAWQSDFGNIYKSNEVTNDVPLIDPNKDAVLSISNLQSLDKNANPTSSIENRTHFQYRLVGSSLPKNLAAGPHAYEFVDSMDVSADEYSGRYYVECGHDIFLKDGTVIKANSELTKFTTQRLERNVSKGENTPVGATGNNADTTITRITISFDKWFLDQIDWSKTAWQVDAFLDTKRIAEKQNVTNRFVEYINGIDFGSKVVTTNTRRNTDDAQWDAINNNKDKIEENKDAIKQIGDSLLVVHKDLNDKIDNTKDEINDALDKIKDDVQKKIDVVKDLAQKAHDRLDALEKQKQEEAAKEKPATLVIFSPEVKTEADALHYAVTHGINPKAITKIYQKDSYFVVQYMESTVKDAPQEKSSKIEIYSPDVKSETEAFDYAVSHGVAKGSITRVVKEKGRYVVYYTEAAKKSANEMNLGSNLSVVLKEF